MKDASPSHTARLQELEAKVAELEIKLNYDGLTGAFTRQYLYDRLAGPLPVGKILIFADLDDFKSVNDHYGHLAGDRLLQLITKAMMAAVGSLGIVVRVSGDEFIILLDDMADDTFTELEGRVRDQIRNATLKVGPLDVSRTASLGYVRLDAGMDLQQALDIADNALLEAKREGKNRTLGTHQKRRQPVPQLPSLDAVRRGLQDHEIGYHVQPIFRTDGTSLEGYEALLRWSRPSGEVLGPSQFLHTMTKAYDAMTRPPLWAARQTSEWAVLDRSKYISFNISEAFIKRIADEGLAWVDELVGNVPHDMIVFELLETIVDRSEDAAAAAISKLRQKGIRVALDDFGTGYSNLQRLQGLDVDLIKIDKRFVHGAAKSSRGLDILASMVDLSHRLSAQTVIEGIETAQHLDLARQVGATYVQGFFLGRPKPISHS